MIVVAATLDDIDAICAIEQQSFPRPWPRESFVAELDREHARIAVARSSAQSPNRPSPPAPSVAGFIDYWIVTDEVHVLSIATHPDHRRGGIGRALVAHALAEGRARACRIATLEVRASNAAAIALYTSAGFESVHVRKRYYQDNNEDAIVMIAQLGE